MLTPYLPPPVRRADAVSIFIETFRAWAKDWPAYLGLSAVAGLATVGILLATTWVILGVPHPTTGFLVPSLPTVTITIPVAYLYVTIVAPILGVPVAVIFAAAITYYDVCQHRAARVSWSRAFRTGFLRFPSVFVGSLVLALLGETVTLLSILPFVNGTPGQPNPVFAAGEGGLLFVLIAAVFLSVSLGLYAPAIMMEGAGGLAGLRRSWSLTRGHRLSIFGAQLLLGLIAFAVLAAATFPLNALGNVFLSTAAQVAATAVTGSWSILLAASAYELIGEEQREMARQRAVMTWVPLTAPPERAPAYKQPGAPVCPTCGRPILWVPAYGRWYCKRCGAYR